MAKTEVSGEIDLTHLPGERHLSEAHDKTVGGTTDDDLHEENTVSVPSNIPEEFLTSKTIKAFNGLLSTDDTQQIAERYGISTTTVNKSRQIASAFYHPDELPFDIPDQPSWESVEQIVNATQHPESRDDVRHPGQVKRRSDNTSSSGSRSSDGKAELVREILGRYYKLNQSTEEIADEMGIDSVHSVQGSLAAKTRIDESQWIVPDADTTEESDDGQDEAVEETDSNTVNTDVHFGARLMEPDIRDCDCSIPQLAVESATAGPSSLQSLFCEKCGYEFTALYNNGG